MGGFNYSLDSPKNEKENSKSMTKHFAFLLAFAFLVLPWEASVTGTGAIAGIAAHQIEALMFAAIRVTALSVLITNTVLTVIPGEFLSERVAAGHSPPRKPNGG